MVDARVNPFASDILPHQGGVVDCLEGVDQHQDRDADHQCSEGKLQVPLLTPLSFTTLFKDRMPMAQGHSEDKLFGRRSSTGGTRVQ